MGPCLVPVSGQTPAPVPPEAAFDRQVLDTLLGRGMDEFWDINGSANRFNPGLPVAIHFSEWGQPVDLGEAARQRAVNEPFELIIGFYEKLPSSSEATVVAVHDIKIDAARWEKLWGKITLAEIKQLEAAFKTGPDKNAMFYAMGECSRIGKKGSAIQIEPRISRNKRQIACYIPFGIFCTELLNDPVPKKQQGLALWGQPFKSRIDLGSKPPETLVAAVDRSGKPAIPKNTAVKKAEPPAIEVKTSQVVLKDPVLVGTTPVKTEPAKATPEEIEAAIEAAQQGKLTPATPGVISDTPAAPPPPVDTGWSRIEVQPVKIK